MNTVQIMNVMNNNKIMKTYFKGVFSCDKLPKYKIKKTACYIINTDPSSKPGTHWVAIFFPKKGYAEYFDSFGFEPKIKSIIKFIMNNSSHYTYNKKQLQNIFSSVCGNYCCEYLLHRCKGKVKSLFLKKYNSKNTANNDVITMKHFKSNFM